MIGDRFQSVRQLTKPQVYFYYERVMSSSKTAILSSILLIAAGLIPAHGRLGESREECIERYGTPIGTPEPVVGQSTDTAAFLKDKVHVHVEFRDDVVWYIEYRSNVLAADLRAQLLEGNRNGSSWADHKEMLGRTYYVTNDRKVNGVYLSEGALRLLRFCDSTCSKALDKQRKVAIKKTRTASRAAASSKEEEKSSSGF